MSENAFYQYSGEEKIIEAWQAGRAKGLIAFGPETVYLNAAVSRLDSILAWVGSDTHRYIQLLEVCKNMPAQRSFTLNRNTAYISYEEGVIALLESSGGNLSPSVQLIVSIPDFPPNVEFDSRGLSIVRRPYDEYYKLLPDNRYLFWSGIYPLECVGEFENKKGYAAKLYHFDFHPSFSGFKCSGFLFSSIYPSE